MEQKRGRSLNPTPSMKLYIYWQWRWRNYNRTAHLVGKNKLSFKAWCYNMGIDLSGRTKIENGFLNK